jgi:exodeoxyribonuclease VII large subunit
MALPVYTVSEFIGNINAIIVGQFTVEGEVSQFKISQGKWAFFDLKDPTGVLSCFAVAFQLKVPLEDGIKVRVTGYPKVREQTGRFGFVVQSVELVGDGALKRAYELLKKKLSEEGLFAPARKRAIPKIPNRIAVIASRDSAAFGDFKRIITNRWPAVEVVIRHVAVQGETAVADVVSAFQEFNAAASEFDVLVIIRGGGSLEDLAAFNTEPVVRAVYGSVIPVVSGIGHERDETLIDFVADVRASTPSNAAEMVVPDKRDFLSQCGFMVEQMGEVVAHQVLLKKQRVQTGVFQMTSRLEAPLQRSKQLLQSFFNRSVRLEALVMAKKTMLQSFTKNADKLTHLILRREQFLESSERLLTNINPRRILGRGYSIARNSSGAIVRSAKELDVAERFVLELGEGTITGSVIEKNI